MNINILISEVRNTKAYSAWDSGVKDYALMLLENTTFPDNEVTSADELRCTLLNGAYNWQEYSQNGYALLFNEDIASMLCTQTELRRNKHGKYNPNDTVTWIDLQAVALNEAYLLIANVFNQLTERSVFVCMQ